MSGIKIPVGIAFDKGTEDRVIQEFTQQFNKLGESIGRANKQKFSPIDRGSLDDMRRLTAGFESLKKVSGDLNKRLRATGQDKSSFMDVDWNKLYPDQHSRGRQMQKAFEYVTGGGRFAPGQGAPGPAPGGGGGGARPPAAPPAPRNYGRNIVSAGLRAAGPVGGVADGALSAGMSGGAMAGLAGLAGGLAALAIGKVVGAVTQKIGAAQNEFIGYDTLKRQLGDVNISFGALKESLRSASRGLDMTFDEGLKLGQQFARLANLSGEQYKTLGEEVQHAGGFGRSFGMDPSQSNAFFAQMRMSKVTSNVDDSRRLGLLIGEGIAKSGAFAQADQVLEAIAAFATSQARQGMNAANVAGYTGMLTGMIGSGIAGMDPASAAALLGRANSTFSGGGGGGEAGQNFIYSAVGSRMGLNPIQTAMMREQGLFGTGAGTFGKGSTWERFAQKNPGVGGTGTAATSTQTNLELVMEHFKKTYAGRPELMVNAMSNLFGVNNSQAMALSTIDPKSLGGLASRLQRNGVNINDVNASGISRIAQLEADGSLSEAEKDKRIKEAAGQNQEQTEGSRTRATINGVERAIQDMAGRLVPIMNDVRSGVMYLAGEGGKHGPRDIQEAIARADSKDRTQAIASELDPQIAEAEKKGKLLKGRRSGVTSQVMANTTQEERQKYNEKILALEKDEAENQQRIKELKKQRADRLAQEERVLAESLRTIKDPAGVAGAGRGSINPSMPDEAPTNATGTAPTDGSRSYRNNNPGNIEFNEFSKSLGATGSDGRFAVFPSYDAGRKAQEKLLFEGKNYRDLTLSQAAGRWAPASENDTGAYSKALLGAVGGQDKKMADYTAQERARILDAQQRHEGWSPATPLPEPGRPAEASAGGAHRVDISGVFNLVGPNGQPAAAPVHVATKVGRPVAAGAGS